MDDESLERLRVRLDETLSWPCLYTFKFIVPAARVEDVVVLFPEGHAVLRRPSRNGKYVGLTAELMVYGSREVIAFYQKASRVDGILCL